MMREPIEFLSSDGQHTLRGELWLPPGEVRGLVQLVHGMNDHGGRYESLFRYLNERGYAAAFHDHLGHGLTANDESELGYFADHHGDRLLVADTIRCFELLAKRFDPLPHYLMGHSMGSYIVRLVIAEYKGPLDGAVIMGTGGKNSAALPGSKLASLMGLLRGKHYRTRFINDLAFKSYAPKGDGDPDETPMSAWLNRDMDEVRKFCADEKCNHVFTAAGFRDLFMLAHRSNLDGAIQAIPRDLPLLFLSGGQDALGRNGADILALEKRLREQGQTDLTVHIYPGARHELCLELNRDEVFGDLTNWLETHGTGA